MYKNLEKKLITEFIIFNILIIRIIPINNFIINITSLHFSFCTILSSDSFQRAKDKLKRAEMVTDVNTDVDETAKKRRKITAAKRLSSSDSEDEDLLTLYQHSHVNQLCGNKVKIIHLYIIKEIQVVRKLCLH